MKSHHKAILLRSSSFFLAGLFIFFFSSLLLVIVEVQKSQTALSRAQEGGTCIVSGNEQALDPEEQKFIRLLNEYRGQNGLDPVDEDAVLSKAAAWMAKDMARNNRFSHTDSQTRDLTMRIEHCGYDPANGVKENIAHTHQTAEQVLKGWKDSNEHNQAMLDPEMTAAGIGRDFVKPSDYDWYWALVLGGVAGGEQSPTTNNSPGGDSGDKKRVARGGRNFAKKSSSKKSSKKATKKAAKTSGKKTAKKDDKGKKGKNNTKNNGKKNNKNNNNKKNDKKKKRKNRKRNRNQEQNTPTATPTPVPGTGTTVTPGAPTGTTPVATPSGTMLKFAVTLVGIGPRGNPSPISTERDVTVTVVDLSGAEVSNTLDLLTLNALGQYAGTIDVGDVPDGTYNIKIQFDNTLRKNIIPEFQQLTAKEVNVMPPLTLSQGDLDGNNQIDLADFNVFMSCFETDCDDPFSDINDDGIVNAFDFNLMRENFASREGS